MMKIGNSSAMMAVAEWRKNDKKLEKQLKKVATGMKIGGAGDDASTFAISEKMRVRIRALSQNDQNVQTGMSLLRVAGGAVQREIDLLKAIRQKVIDANNDTNTDSDRATIQKEIDQRFREMGAITYDTTYNGRRLLIGNTEIDHEAMGWMKKDTSEYIEGSDEMQLIPDIYETLDGQKGWFDIFKTSGTMASTIPLLGITGTKNFSGGTDGTPNTYTIDFSNYSSVADFEGVGLAVESEFVLGTLPGKYPGYMINTSSANTVEDVIDLIAAQLKTWQTQGGWEAFSGIVRDGKTLKLTSWGKCAGANNMYVQPFSRKGYGATYYPPLDDWPATGLLNPSKQYLTGGRDASGGTGQDMAPYVPAIDATFSVDVSAAAAGTGISWWDGNLRFIDGTSGFQEVEKSNSGYYHGTYTIGKDCKKAVLYTNGSNENNPGGSSTVTYENGILTISTFPPLKVV